MFAFEIRRDLIMIIIGFADIPYRMSQADEIARLVIEKYERLPSKGKPLTRSNGVCEWTVLAGIAVQVRGHLECVALATGVKALPDEVITDSNGKVLHDCHAEVLAIRAFNLYCIRNGVDHIEEVHLYVCAPPCGDASMSLLNSAGEEWTREEKPGPDDIVRGRAHFGLVGSIRTKPGRADSSVTMSKSCSDKLCLRQRRGLLLSPAKRLFGRTFYLDSLVCAQVLPDYERAFSRWDPIKRFATAKTTVPFTDYHPEEGKPSPCSLVWVPNDLEIIANGIVQGSRGKPSMVSRHGLLYEAVKANAAAFDGLNTYYDLKMASFWPNGWVRTGQDDLPINTT